MSASKILNYGDPVVALDVSRLDAVVVHPCFVQDIPNPNEAVVHADGSSHDPSFEKTYHFSDPRILTVEEALNLRDPSQALVWFEGIYPLRVVETIAQKLAAIEPLDGPLGI